MRKISKILISLAAVLTLGFVATPAFASTADDLRAADQKLSTAAQTFVSDVQSASDLETISTVVGEFKDAADSAKAEFARITDEAKSDGWKTIANKMTKAVDDMSAAASEFQTAIATQDVAAITTAGEKFQTAVDEYQAAASEANEYIASHPLDSGDSQYMLWFGLLVVAMVCLIGAVVMVVMTRRQTGSIINKRGKTATLKGLRILVLSGAIVFVVGAAIPAVQYWWGVTHAKDDGTFTYYIFYWPLVLGAIWFVLGLVQYLSTYLKLKKSGGLVHSDNAAEVAASGEGIRVPKIGEKIEKK